MTEAQIRSLYRETIDPLYAWVSRRCGGDRSLAEDITQETWLRAIRHWQWKGVPDRPLAWLTTVARNLLFNEFRRRRPVPLDAVNATEVLTAADNGRASEKAEIAAAVNRALERLPARQSRLLEAFHYDRHSVAEIAERHGLSERAVEGRLRRARSRLRRELEAMFQTAGGMTS